MRLRGGTAFQLRGTSFELSFEADLPLGGMTGCPQMSFTATTLQRQCAARAGGRCLENFDKVLHYMLAQCNTGFVHVVDWRGLSETGFLQALCGAAPLLPASAALYAQLRGSTPGSVCPGSGSISFDSEFFLQCSALAGRRGLPRRCVPRCRHLARNRFRRHDLRNHGRLRRTLRGGALPGGQEQDSIIELKADKGDDDSDYFRIRVANKDQGQAPHILFETVRMQRVDAVPAVPQQPGQRPGSVQDGA